MDSGREPVETMSRLHATPSMPVSNADKKQGLVRSEAITVMKELGKDISRHGSKGVDEFAGEQFDFVLIVCDHARRVPHFSKEGTTIYHNVDESIARCPTRRERAYRAFHKSAAFDWPAAQSNRPDAIG